MFYYFKKTRTAKELVEAAAKRKFQSYKQLEDNTKYQVVSNFLEGRLAGVLQFLRYCSMYSEVC